MCVAVRSWFWQLVSVARELWRLVVLCARFLQLSSLAKGARDAREVVVFLLQHVSFAYLSKRCLSSGALAGCAAHSAHFFGNKRLQHIHGVYVRVGGCDCLLCSEGAIVVTMIASDVAGRLFCFRIHRGSHTSIPSVVAAIATSLAASLRLALGPCRNQAGLATVAWACLSCKWRVSLSNCAT